jgi:hypothetical protein
MNMLAKKAVQNPEILNPRTRADTNNSIIALITRRKRPRVITVNGSVRMTRIGHITASPNQGGVPKRSAMRYWQNGYR